MNSSGIKTLRQRLSRFRRLGLAQLPTPLQRLDRLSEDLGGPTLWVKREDLTGLGMGGNKLRKLDYVLFDAVAAGCDAVVSGGVVQSNSQRQVAAVAAKLGLECHLAVYHGRVPAPSTDYETNGNALLNRVFGAKLYDVPWTGDRNAAIETLRQDLVAQGKQPLMVPYGVSNGLGAVGYASAALEIAEHFDGMGIVSSAVVPSAIVHCSGSGGTQAGLTVGAAVCMPGTSVLGIDIDAEPARVYADVMTYTVAASELLECDVLDGCVEVVAGLAGPGYGVPHEKTVEAIRKGGRLEGLVLDPVYSGKGLAGLISMVEAGRWARDEHVVFVHTGGEPALFAYGSTLGL